MAAVVMVEKHLYKGTSKEKLTKGKRIFWNNCFDGSSDVQQHSGQHTNTKGRKKKRCKRQNSQQTLSEPTNDNTSDNAITTVGDTKGESEVIVTYDSNSGHSTINMILITKQFL